MALQIEGEDHYVEVEGLRLHYREWGERGGVPVVILHGLTGHAREFDHLARALSDQYRVLVLDQRGHGESSWADRYDPGMMAEDVAHFLRRLDLDRVHLIGHSMGGANAWWFAARHPERVAGLAIIDVDPHVITSQQSVELWRGVLASYAAASFASAEEAASAYIEEYDGLHADELRTFARNNVVAREGAWRWRFDAERLIGWMESAAADADSHWHALKGVAAPTLIVHAGDSPFTDEVAMLRMVDVLDDARLIRMEDAGHDIHIDQRDALVKALRSFLAAATDAGTRASERTS